MFMKALECEVDVHPKAMINLGLLYNIRGNGLAQTGDLDGAKQAALDAAKFLDTAKPLLDAAAATGKADSDIAQYQQQYRPVRLQSHRLLGQVLAGAGDLAGSESEFRRATENFPNEPSAWQMLGKVLEMQGKTEEVQSVKAKLNSMRPGL